jgi:superfamily II DNA or RNA helicase
MRPQLRDYQQEANHALRVAFKGGKRRQVLVAPTGAGKSVCAHDLVATSAMKSKRVLFVVNRIQLVQQFSARLKEAGIEHGILRGDETEKEWHPVLVASVQTAVKREIDKPNVIIVDEAHGVPGSKHYIDLLAKFHDVPVLGLTATPWAKGMGRVNDRLGGVLFEHKVVASSYSKLIAGGHLVPFEVWAPTLPDLTGVKKQRNQFGEQDFSEKDLGEAMNKPKLIGDIVSHWMRIARGKKTVVFAVNIKHSLAIVEAFNNAGVSAEHIDCYCDSDERKEILARVDEGKSTVISCAALLAEGWDQPSIECMILARPTKSRIRYIQMCGRVMRPYPGKTKAILIDHTGSCQELGFPDVDQDYTLDGHKPDRKSEPKKKEPARCPKCGFIDHYRAHKQDQTCPQCGYLIITKGRHIEAVDGELEQVKRTKVTQADKQSWYSQLLAIANERGRSSGWVSNTYRKKFGVWPRGLYDSPIEPTPEVRGYVKHLDIRYAKSQQAVKRSIENAG